MITIEKLNIEDKYTICPKCGFEKYWYKFINKIEMDLCSLCGYWEPRNICEDELGLMDLDDKKK